MSKRQTKDGNIKSIEPMIRQSTKTFVFIFRSRIGRRQAKHTAAGAAPQGEDHEQHDLSGQGRHRRHRYRRRQRGQLSAAGERC